MGPSNGILNDFIDMGIYGGFSFLIPVPAIDLCEVTNRGNISLEKLAVVADAATTPFQAAKRADVQVGDNVIVIGVGGVALGTSGIAPVGIAVITAYLAISTVKYFKAEQDAM